MTNLKYQHLLTGEELSTEEIHALLLLASKFKNKRKKGFGSSLLKGKHLALLFEKPSLRTRFSFAVAMHELGGHVIESVSETRKKEEPEDMVRVLEGYCHGIMIRTHSDDILSRMGKIAKIPIINALSDLHHPCQILADLFTLQEVFGSLNGLNVTYIGDGNNILHSLLLIAPRLGVHLHYCCPQKCQPHADIVNRALLSAKAAKGSVRSCSSPLEAVSGSHAVYTDVWTSMGFEGKTDEDQFIGFQVNEELMKHAEKNALFMHCMPMHRGKEVSQTLPDSPTAVIFQQSENRLHIQKAILATII